MLPDMSGLDICKKIRNNSDSFDIAIIMLTAKGEEVDRVLGFELGADDYVVKPFSVRELALRVSTVLKRREKQEETSKISLGDIEINLLISGLLISNCIAINEPNEKPDTQHCELSKFSLSSQSRAAAASASSP